MIRMSKNKNNSKGEDQKKKKENTENTANEENINEDVQSEKKVTRDEPVKEETKDRGEDWQTKYLRLMADFQNYKKRIESERSQIYARANEQIIVDLLNVIDNFDRALGTANKDDNKEFVEGVQMIYKQLLTVLQNEGVEEIEALGETFDPNVHNAVMTAPSDEYEEGKVSAVLQKGYTLKGKVIRPSMVQVAQ